MTKKKVQKTDAEWKAQLSDMQYHVARNAGTERAFTGKYWDHHGQGVYACVCCGEPLFASDTKYNSGSGWPSFYAPVSEDVVEEVVDKSVGMVRTEAVCSNCDAHLGHVFNDGPKPTGVRYCMNSASLNFVEGADAAAMTTGGEQDDSAGQTAEATFGAGCFWCVEAVFQDLEGVISVESGYSNGRVKKPTYKEVCSGLTGHAEVLRVVYDPAVITFEELLEVFWMTHDPTTLNRQGNDVGTQYRSGVYYHDAEQKAKAEFYLQKLESQKVYDKPIVTEIVAIDNYWPAENYHQNYFNEHGEEGYCRMVIRPKVEKFRQAFSDKIKR